MNDRDRPLNEYNSSNNKRLKIAPELFNIFPDALNHSVRFDNVEFNRICDILGINSFRIRVNPKQAQALDVQVAKTKSDKITRREGDTAKESDFIPTIHAHYLQSIDIILTVNPDSFPRGLRSLQRSSENQTKNPEEFAKRFNSYLRRQLGIRGLKYNTLDLAASQAGIDIAATILTAYFISNILEAFLSELTPGTMSWILGSGTIYFFFLKLIYFETYAHIKTDPGFLAPFGLNPEKLIRVLYTLSTMGDLIKYSELETEVTTILEEES